MAKLRKMLGSADSPYIISLMRLIETQSKATLANWGMDYVEAHILPIYKKSYPEDNRLSEALRASRASLEGKIKVAEVRKIVKEVQTAAKEAEVNPVAQAAARAVGVAAGIVYTPTHSLAVAFYGSAAIVYDCIGIDEKETVYDQMAS
ncbi:MAG: putative immunity protein, partial [Cellulosilyticaceae bacterium]